METVRGHTGSLWLCTTVPSVKAINGACHNVLLFDSYGKYKPSYAIRRHKVKLGPADFYGCCFMV